MFKISNNFVGGNISIVSQNENEVTLKNELRDTNGSWFYWAFCVEGAAGRELTFHMEPKRLGYWGPAVSHDLKEWHWLNDCDGDSFTYRFASNENKVYFAHSMLYHPDRFFAFCENRGLEATELCKSHKGRSVPCLNLGEGNTSILFTARHHACESPGSYVMEGVITELCNRPIPNSRVLFVPFVDYDGVVDGDQGKSRIPHDHNRDYRKDPIYPEVRSICQYANLYGVNYGFDLHAPSHKGKSNDNIFVVRNRVDKQAEFDAFSEIFEAEITENSMYYAKCNDIPPCTGWNQPSENFGYTMHCRPECKLAFSLENAYFGTEQNKVTGERLVELGKCFAKAIKKYINRLE